MRKDKKTEPKRQIAKDTILQTVTGQLLDGLLIFEDHRHRLFKMGNK